MQTFLSPKQVIELATQRQLGEQGLAGWRTVA